MAPRRKNDTTKTKKNKKKRNSEIQPSQSFNFSNNLHLKNEKNIDKRERVEKALGGKKKNKKTCQMVRQREEDVS